MPSTKLSMDEIYALVTKAKENDAVSQNLLGVHYASGDVGGGVDNNKAIGWYLRSSCQGYTEAMWNAGSMLIDGEESVAKDSALGLLLIRVSAEAFHSSACLFLAGCYERGRYGVPVVAELANFWMQASWSYGSIREYSASADVELISSYIKWKYRRQLELD